VPSPFYDTSSRLGLRMLKGESLISDIDSGFRALAEGMDGMNEGHQDFLQAGVVRSTDWAFAATINSGTGALGSEGVTGGVAWLPDPVVSGALMRTVATPARLENLTTGGLPTSGKYTAISYALEATKWGAAPNKGVVPGVQKNTQAEAEAAFPALGPGVISIRDIVVKNTAGVYSIVFGRDRRPWAGGAHVLCSSFSESGGRLAGSTSYVILEGGNLQRRLECSGMPLRFTYLCNATELPSEGSAYHVTVFGDGVNLQPNGGVINADRVYGTGPQTYPTTYFVGFAWEYTPSAGSHLFSPYHRTTATGINKEGGPNAASTCYFSIEEVRPSAHNGIS